MTLGIALGLLIWALARRSPGRDGRMRLKPHRPARIARKPISRSSSEASSRTFSTKGCYLLYCSASGIYRIRKIGALADRNFVRSLCVHRDRCTVTVVLLAGSARPFRRSGSQPQRTASPLGKSNFHCRLDRVRHGARNGRLIGRDVRWTHVARICS